MNTNYFDKEIKNCSCGKNHICPIESVEIGKDAISKLDFLCQSYKNILLVSDENTFKVCGEKVYYLINKQDLLQSYIRSSKGCCYS